MKIVERMGHVALRVPDLDPVLRHATEILGLRVVSEEDGWICLTCGPRHHDLMLAEGDELALDHVSFEAPDAAAIEQLAGALARDGVEILSDRPEEPGVAHSLRFRAPGGHVFEVYAEMEQAPAHYNGPGVRPRKYGHTTLRALSVREMAEFAGRYLGFIESDRVGDQLRWMRCDADHHGLALFAGDPPGLHHHAWEVESWSYLELLGDRLLANGKRLLYGPGRHGPGLNLFSYHLDPAGVCIEYFADIEQVHDPANLGRDWPNTGETINQWGPAPPDEFLTFCAPVAEPTLASIGGS